MGKRAEAALVATPAEVPSWLIDIAADAELEAQAEEELANKPVTNQQLMEYAKELTEVEEEKKRITAELKQLDDRRKQLRTQLIPDMMKALGMVNANGKGVFTFGDARFHLEQKLYASVSKDQRPVFYAYLRERGDDNLIQEVVNAQTLSAYIRECRSEGLNDPPGVSVHEEVTAKMTKVK